MIRSNIGATSGSVKLAGSLWVPTNRAPSKLLLMYPGSGPSDRDNDVFFPPIRRALIDAGVAVASFDKRGVGSSSGNWLEAGIDDQAADLCAFLQETRSLVPGIPIGLFGHSQGGWVVLEAAHSASVDFVITSSGPAVTPRVQEEFSTRNGLVGIHTGEPPISDLLRSYGELLDRLSAGDSFEQVSEWMNEPMRSASFAALKNVGAFIPDDAAVWRFAHLLINYDPTEALAALRVPLLALLGSVDMVVPVVQSVKVLRAVVKPELLIVRVIDGGDHRMQFPASGAFAPDYLPALVNFVAEMAVSTGQRHRE